jgi:endonuclease/exonuclease/phosphatase family metal-dependent hydrolase
VHIAADVAFRVATFNAGLAVGVLPYATERAPHVVAALAAIDVDLLFVQEFWLDTHWELLRDAVRARLPHTLRPEPLGQGLRATCREAELAPLRKCAESRCAGLRDEALARCVVQHCASLALVLPTACLNCIASHPVGSLEEIFDRCLASDTVPPPSTTDYGQLIAYGGSFGTGLLSRNPFNETETLVFKSSVNARGALHVDLSSDELGKLHVFAAHLSPGGAEQPLQVKQLLAWIDQRSESAPAILLGDLNTTPGSTLFEHFERAGFREANAADVRATFAHDGLGTGNVGASGYRLDHVLVRGIDTEVRTQRILDRPLTISAGGKAVRTTLSDHFGILATIEDQPTSRQAST